MAVIPMERTVSLDEPIKVEKLTGTLFTAENNAHKFIISVTRGGEAEPVTGTVTARFKRQDGSAVFITGGVEDGAACVVLTADCYNQPGGFQLTVFTTEGGSTLAIYSAVGVVTSTVDGDLIDGGNTIPRSVDEVAAYLEQYAPRVMTGATPTTDGVAGLVPAPNSLASTYYLRGDGTWDDLRTVIYNCFPVAWAPMDNGVHGWWPYDENGWMIPNDAANNVPPQVMNVALLAGPDTSYDSLTLTFVYLNMIPYGSITINFVELLGHPFNGGNTVQIDSNGIVIAGVRYAQSYNIPMMGSMVVKADQVCSFQIAYRQNPVAVIQSLNNRITALENAST